MSSGFSPKAAGEAGWRHRVRHAAFLPLSLLLPDVPLTHPFKGFYRQLRAALAVHLVAQSERGRRNVALGPARL